MQALSVTTYTVPLHGTLFDVIYKLKMAFIFLVVFDYIYLFNFLVWDNILNADSNGWFIFFWTPFVRVGGSTLVVFKLLN